MPYDRNADLPTSLDVLPERGKTVWRRVFNQNVDKGDEAARRIAWTAVKNGWDKGDEGKWHRKVAAEAFAAGCQHCGWGTGELVASEDDCAFCAETLEAADELDEPLLAEQHYQTRGGKQFHKSDFFYTPSDDPSTWKLLKTGTPGGAPDAGHVGAAAAALGKGFRGSKVSIPQSARAGVKAKVRAAWRKLHPDASSEDMPAVLRAEAGEGDDIPLMDAASESLTLYGIALEAMGVSLPTMDDHPNRVPFEGILTRVDSPSDKPPAGSQGHRVLLPRAVAEAALPSLIGMGVDMDGSFDRHDPRRKIGVITEAWLQGNAVHVKGILYARDFPQEVARIQTLARQGLMGMSFELAGAEIAHPHDPIWRLKSCTFTGAAILKRASAAYRATALAAQGQGQGDTMDDDTSTATNAVTLTLAANAADLVTLQANMDSLMQTMQQMAGQMESYQACMRAMESCVNMRGQLDGLTEALEHLVKMHQALHELGPVPGEPDEAMAGAATGEGDTMDATDKARLAKVEAGMVDLAAAVQLMTDSVQEVKGLITDRQQGANGLLTDAQGRLTANGRLIPQRRTLQAQGEYERCVAKYGLEQDKTYSEREIDQVLRNAGIAEVDKRLAVKIELQACGVMAR